MERWRTERNSYQNPLNLNPPQLPVSLQTSPASTSGTPIYNITVATPTPAFYVLTATPVAPGPMANDGCGNFTLDSTGLRGRSGAVDINTCWGR
jgi:type IV pilus assembly protein PilE